MRFHETCSCFSFGPYRLNPNARVLLRGDHLIPIGSRAFDILVALVENHGKVLSHADLMAFAWPGLNVEASNIRVQMTHLRREIRCGENGNRYIVSVAGRGYSFVAPIVREEAVEPGQTEHASSMAYAKAAASLPPRLNHPIGREDNIKKLSQMVEERRFVTIVGAGGIGKTTLAILVAHALPTFERVFFVDLSTIDDATAVLGALAGAMQPPLPSNDIVADIVSELSSRRALLILDNCEHVIDAVADVIASLLGRTPNAHILTTSREAFRLPGEALYLLRPLGVPPHTRRLTAAQALLWPSIQLFMDRAVDSGHLEPLCDEHAGVVATICRRLDGNPLAIELVASRMGHCGLALIAELLDNQLALRWRGSRHASPRHQTAEAMMDWSYSRLPESDQRLFRRLSLFSGGFSVEAAIATMEDDALERADVIESIGNLIDKSLLSLHSGKGPPQLRLSGIAKTYATFKFLASGEHRTIEQSLLGHVKSQASSKGERAMRVQIS